MTITLTSGITHDTDTHVRLINIGVDYQAQAVILTVRLQQTGEKRIYTIGSRPGDIDTIPGFVAAFPAFSGLRPGIETYLTTKVPELAGTTSVP